jgi:hypothetical protein
MLDTVALAVVLAAAGAAVLLWMPVLVVWTALVAFRQQVLRRMRPYRDLSPVA